MSVCCGEMFRKKCWEWCETSNITQYVRERNQFKTEKSWIKRSLFLWNWSWNCRRNESCDWASAQWPIFDNDFRWHIKRKNLLNNIWIFNFWLRWPMHINLIWWHHFCTLSLQTVSSFRRKFFAVFLLHKSWVYGIFPVRFIND